MIVKKAADVTIVYNDKEHYLVMSALDREKETPIITVGGWFGKKLYEFLQSDGDLEKFLQPFEHHKQWMETFQRLILTLTQQEVIDVFPERELAHLSAFSDRECMDFSQGDFTGSLEFKRFNNEELLAYAHIVSHCGNRAPSNFVSHGKYHWYQLQSAGPPECPYGVRFWTAGDSGFT